MYKRIIRPVVLYGTSGAVWIRSMVFNGTSGGAVWYQWCCMVPVVLYGTSGVVWSRSMVLNGTSGGAVWYQWCCMDQKRGV
jgi:hypothetical protein